MFTKVYDKVLKILKENYKSLIIFILAFFICTFEFPYYIDTPGGLINIEDRISVSDSYESEGSFNLAYVSELKATIPTLFLSLFHKEWNIVKEEEIAYDHETIEDALLRDRILLEESIANATIVAYQKAGKPCTIESQRLVIMYIDQNALTNLKVGDELLEADGIELHNKEDLNKIIQEHQKEDTIILKIKRDNQIKEAYVTMQKFEESYKMGLVLSLLSQVKTKPEVQTSFQKQESGPSGGLMSTLYIYNSLTKQDYTQGLTVVGTGTIELDGSVGSIGGVAYKIKGAVKKKADIFFVPAGENYEEALQVVKENNYKITLVSVSTFDEALAYLEQQAVSNSK